MERRVPSRSVALGSLEEAKPNQPSTHEILTLGSRGSGDSYTTDKSTSLLPVNSAEVQLQSLFRDSSDTVSQDLFDVPTPEKLGFFCARSLGDRSWLVSASRDEYMDKTSRFYLFAPSALLPTSIRNHKHVPEHSSISSAAPSPLWNTPLIVVTRTPVRA